VWIGSGAAEQRLLMNSSAGLGFLCKLGDLATKTRQGKDFMKVDEGASALAPALVKDEKYLAALSSDARLLLFEIAEVPERPNGGVGVQLLAVPENEKLAAVALTDGRTLVVSGIKRKNRASETLDAKQLAEHMGKRAQRGRVCDVGFRPDRLETAG
jgi:topoisomerase IV subunit A